MEEIIESIIGLLGLSEYKDTITKIIDVLVWVVSSGIGIIITAYVIYKYRSKIPTWNHPTKQSVNKDVKNFVEPSYSVEIPLDEPTKQPNSKGIHLDVHGERRESGNIYSKFLTKWLSDWIMKRKFVLIIADSGVGKTTFLEKLYYDFRRGWSKFPFKEASSIFLYKMSKEGLQQLREDIKNSIIKNIDEKILLLDSLDEYIIETKETKTVSKILEELYLEFCSFQTTVISCRTQHIKEDLETVKKIKISIENYGGHDADLILGFYYLNFFEIKDIMEYIDKKFGWFEWTNKRKAKELANSSFKFMQRPMLLSYIKDLVEPVYQINENSLEKMKMILSINKAEDKMLEPLKSLKNRDYSEKELRTNIETQLKDDANFYKIWNRIEEDLVRECRKQENKIEYSFQVYKTLVRKWLEREKKKCFDDKILSNEEKEKFIDNLYSFSKEVAKKMYPLGVSISAEDCKQILTSLNLNLSEYIIKFHSLFFPVSADKYVFAHRSIYEYLFVRHCIDNPTFYEAEKIELRNMEDGFSFFQDICTVEYTDILIQKNAAFIKEVKGDKTLYNPELIQDVTELNLKLEYFSETNTLHKPVLLWIIVGFQKLLKLTISYKGVELYNFKGDNGYDISLKFRDIKKIDWSNKEYKDEDFFLLKYLLDSLYNLEELNLSHNSLTKVELSNQSLKELNLSHNNITDLKSILNFKELPSILKMNNNPLQLWQLILSQKKNKSSKTNFLDIVRKTKPMLEDTFLHYICKYNMCRTVKKMIGMGANYQIRDKANETPVMVAYKKGHHKIMDLFYQKVFRWKVLVFGSKEKFTELLEKKEIPKEFTLVNETSKEAKKQKESLKKEAPDILIFLENKPQDKEVENLVLDNPKFTCIILGQSSTEYIPPYLFRKACLVAITKEAQPTKETYCNLLHSVTIGIDCKPKTGWNWIPSEITNSIGMEFVYIPSGEFMMGCSDAEYEKAKQMILSTRGVSEQDKQENIGYLEWEKPSHKVKITNGFYMSKYEVTVGDFREFISATKYQTDAEIKDSAYGFVKGKGWSEVKGLYWNNPGFEQTDDHPVTCISWNDAKEYIEWLNQLDSKNPQSPIRNYKYRLPTEAEWEYAARAGTTTMYYWGDESDKADEYAWFYDNSFIDKENRGTHPVGQKKPNQFGLYDMLGNVWEWVEDRFDENYYKQFENSTAVDPKGSNRVFRGGSWGSDPVICRVSFRYRWDPEHPIPHIFFRKEYTKR